MSLGGGGIYAATEDLVILLYLVLIRSQHINIRGLASSVEYRGFDFLYTICYEMGVYCLLASNDVLKSRGSLALS